MDEVPDLRPRSAKLGLAILVPIAVALLVAFAVGAIAFKGCREWVIWTR